MSLAMRAAATMYSKSRQNHFEHVTEETFHTEDPKQQRRYLQTKIDAAVRDEDYREAARLKKRRDAIKPKSEPKRDFVQENQYLGCHKYHTQFSCWCKLVAEWSNFQSFIIGVIFLAAVLVGIQTYTLSEEVQLACMILDEFVVGIFVAEVFIKVFAEGKRPWRYFLDPWNVFDFIVVAAGFIPFEGGSAVMAIRLVRLLRVLKIVRALPQLRILIVGVLRSTKSIGYIALLLFLLFYLYAVISVSLFGTNDPWHFGNLIDALLSLFRMSTLEDWTDIMYIAIFGCDKYGYDSMPDNCKHPEAFTDWIAFFHMSYIFLSSFMVLNLFIGVITSSIDDAKTEDDEPLPQEKLTKEEASVRNKTLFKRYTKLLGELQGNGKPEPWSLLALKATIEGVKRDERKKYAKVQSKKFMFSMLEKFH